MIDYLSNRLNMVFSLLPSNPNERQRVIDVGSDHGLFSLACLQNFENVFCICTDIHEAPAKRAYKCLEDNGYASRSSAYHTDGLERVELKANDTVVMSGLGGNNIIHIMTEAIKVTPKDVLSKVTWCMQPQKSFDQVRRFCAKEGMELLEEAVCVDKGFHYCGMRYRFNAKTYELTAKQAYYGPQFLENSDRDDVKEYFRYLDRVYSFKARSNMELRKLLQEEGKL